MHCRDCCILNPLIMNFGIQNFEICGHPHMEGHAFYNIVCSNLLVSLYIPVYPGTQVQTYTKITYLNCALNSGRSRILQNWVTISKGHQPIIWSKFPRKCITNSTQWSACLKFVYI